VAALVMVGDWVTLASAVESSMALASPKSSTFTDSIPVAATLPLVIPLVGAFFIDIVNALIIKYFAGLEIMSRVPLPT